MNASLISRTPLTWEAHPARELLRLAGPLVISLLSFSVMTLVDTLFIGQLGALELGATGLGGIAVFTVLSFGLAIFGAAKVKVGEQVGQRNAQSVQRALGAFLRLAIVLGVVSTVLGVALGGLLPYLAGDPVVGRLAGSYASVRALGFGFALTAAAVGQWLQAQGDSKSGMHAALVANAANIPLNALLIFGLGGGVAGAAWATVASGAVEMGWLLGVQARKTIVLPSGARTQPGFHWHKSSWTEAFDAFVLGLPTGLERMLDHASFAAVPLLLSQLAPAHLAAHQIALQIMLVSFLPLFALSEALSVLIAQAVGAKSPHLVWVLTRLGLGMGMIYALIVALSLAIGARTIVAAFSSDVSVIEVGALTLVIGALLQFVNAAYTQLKGALRGLSVFRYVAWVTIGCAWIITPPLTFIIAVWAGFGAPGAWVALCLEVTVGVGLLALRTKKTLAEHRIVQA